MRIFSISIFLNLWLFLNIDLSCFDLTLAFTDVSFLRVACRWRRYVCVSNSTGGSGSSW